MFNFIKKTKAFTIAEVFIAMVILSVLVAVCMSYQASPKDVEREYYYYSAYQNIVKIVNSALTNESYKYGATPRIVNSTCGNKKCVIFNDTNGNLCQIFADYFNIVGTASCTTSTASPWSQNNNVGVALTLTNGMQVYFNNQTAALITELIGGTEPLANRKGWTIWVDLNGDGNGYDKEHYDIMKFYVTLSGKVVPAYGEVSGIRSYETLTKDAAGNSSLMSFDVVYTEADSNVLTVLNDATRHTDFRTAACTSGYISDDASYCSSAPAITKDVTKCDEIWAMCNIRLVQKLQRER